MEKPILPPSEDVITFAELHKRLIRAALGRYKGRLDLASNCIGISSRTLKRWMHSYDIDLAYFKPNNK